MPVPTVNGVLQGLPLPLLGGSTRWVHTEAVGLTVVAVVALVTRCGGHSGLATLA